MNTDPTQWQDNPKFRVHQDYLRELEAKAKTYDLSYDDVMFLIRRARAYYILDASAQDESIRIEVELGLKDLEIRDLRKEIAQLKENPTP